MRVIGSILIAAAAAAATLLFCATSRAQVPPLRVPDALGVNIHFDHPQPGELEMLLAAGFRISRTDILWNQSELKRGRYDFSRWDELFALYDRHHVRAMCPLLYTNPLYDDNLSPHTDEGVAAFAKWAAAAVEHFKGRGVMWEIYNEPNNVFWRPEPDVNAYIKLALATAREIRKVAPNEMIVGPALSGTDSRWLEPCYKAGLLEYFDAVTVHPYGNEPPEDRERHYRGVRKLIDKYQPKGKTIPIFSGEWGYSSAMFPPEQQAKLLARQWLFNLSMNVPVSIWYDWRDDGTDPRNVEHRFGVVENAYAKDRTPPLTPKPAYHAAKTLTTQLDGFTFAKRLPMESKDDFVLLFTRGEETRFAAWTKSDKPRTISFPFELARVRVTDFLGNPSADIPIEDGKVTIELSDGPTYLRP
jgi:hypothetical protein